MGGSGTVRSPASDFGRPIRVVAIGALADVKFAVLEVDVLPSQAAQLGGAQAGEDRGEQHPGAPGRGFERATIARISAGAGISMPALSLPLPSARRERRLLRSE